MDIFRVTVEQENAKISQYSKTAKQKCAKETKRKRVKEFLLRFTQSRDTFVEFIFWNIFSFLFLEYQRARARGKKEKIEMQMSRRNVGCRYAERARYETRERFHTGLNIWLNKIPSRFPSSLFVARDTQS